MTKVAKAPTKVAKDLPTRKIPITMATQHPDNARAPFWKPDNPLIRAHEEIEECVISFRDLKVNEFMWDFEGKYADESVIDKLLGKHYDFFKKKKLGEDIFLTFRIPNVAKEKGYGLIRALMVILTGEDIASDCGFTKRPLFEVILPMTESAEQLLYIQEAFQKMAQFKNSVFTHRPGANTDRVEIIPLVEGVDEQIAIKTLLEKYVANHLKMFGKKPEYLRPFLARSDPALLSGMVANVIANKIALSEMYLFSKEHNIPVYPIIGAGGVPFRGGLNPDRVKQFVKEYAGVRTVTLQSAFRYDYPQDKVRKAINYLHSNIPKSTVRYISEKDKIILEKLAHRAGEFYQEILMKILPFLYPLFATVPKRRERRQHIGLLSYKRGFANAELPRAINFAAMFYSLGIPAEFLGMGKFLASLTNEEKKVLLAHYIFLKEDIVAAGMFLNKLSLKRLLQESSVWSNVAEDIKLTEDFFGVELGPKSKSGYLHESLSTQLLLERDRQEEMSRLITLMGTLRNALG